MSKNQQYYYNEDTGYEEQTVKDLGSPSHYLAEFMDDFVLQVKTPHGEGRVIIIDNKEDFKYLIRAIRDKAQLSQTEMANMLGVNQATVSLWENGKYTPVLETILLISEFIHTPILIGYPRA